MNRLILFCYPLLALLPALPAAAQKIVERQEKLGAGQRVFLNLRPGENIRVRAGQAGEMTFKATVSINQNQLNEAFVLDISRAADELTVKADLDKEALRTAPPGDCPEGVGSFWGESWSRNENGRHEQRRQGVCLSISYDITVPPGTDLRISTISGNISVAGLTGPLQAKSISGDVELNWPAARQAELAMKTITGEVYADPAVAFSNRREQSIVGYEVRGTWKGAGGPAVKLESISGDVFFRQGK